MNLITSYKGISSLEYISINLIRDKESKPASRYDPAWVKISYMKFPLDKKHKNSGSRPASLGT